MPAFVKSEKDWKRARKAADKAGVKGEDYWKYTTSIYKKMRPEDFTEAVVHEHKSKSEHNK